MSVLQTDAFPFRQVAKADPHTRTPGARRATPTLRRRRNDERPQMGAFREERVKGLEPSTFCMASRRSSQLSYTREAGES